MGRRFPARGLPETTPSRRRGTSGTRDAWRGTPRSTARRSMRGPRPTCPSGRSRCDGGCRARPCEDDRVHVGRLHEPFGPSFCEGKPTVAGYLIVNPRSGDGGADELLSAAAERGIATHVLRKGDDLEALARGADADALGMAGGDGSLAAVAGVAIERGLPFVCIPFGTRNHFARDVGLDRDDPVAALDAFSDRVERVIDVGRVN